jgi:hypothetical protein
MGATKSQTTETVEVGRFLVVYCEDVDGQGWEIRGTEEAAADVYDSYPTRREAVAEAKRMEAERVEEETDEAIDTLRSAIDARLDQIQEGPAAL